MVGEEYRVADNYGDSDIGELTVEVSDDNNGSLFVATYDGDRFNTVYGDNNGDRVVNDDEIKFWSLRLDKKFGNKSGFGDGLLGYGPLMSSSIHYGLSTR